MKIKKFPKILISIFIIIMLLITVTYLVNAAMLSDGRDYEGKTAINKIPDLDHTVYISHSIQSPKDIEYSYNFIKNNLSNVYADIAKGHKYFTIRNGKTIANDSIIDCSETAGNQSITHEYHVTELKSNSRIAYVSKGSKVLVTLPWETIESKSNTYVFYDFTDTGNETSEVILTIGIQFSNAFEKFFSVLTGGLMPWKKHCIEEMEGLKSVLSKS